MKRIATLAATGLVALVLASASGGAPAFADTVTVSFPNGCRPFAVPFGVPSVTFTATGSAGETVDGGRAPGGTGDVVSATLYGHNGALLDICVQQFGVTGGQTGLNTSLNGGGGGGAASVSFYGFGPFLVAGGGGGTDFCDSVLTPPPNGCVTGTNSTFGNTSVVVTYTTPPTYTLNGFSQPINDPPGTTPSVFKGGSTVPVKFSLSDPSTGQRISDATASAIASACQATFSPTLAGGSAGTVDETSSAATPTAGNCFRYDSTAHQFVFNWGTKGLPPGKYTLTATVTNPDSSVAAAHSISGVGLR